MAPSAPSERPRGITPDDIEVAPRRPVIVREEPATPPPTPSSSDDSEAAPRRPVIASQDVMPVELSGRRFHVTAGASAPEIARIYDDADTTLLTFRGFASIVGIVAGLVSAIVIAAGVAATLFLIAEKSPLTAIISLVLSFFFAVVVLMLVPPTTVVLSAGGRPMLTISQISRATFPRSRWAVVHDGRVVGKLEKSIFSRLGRNRWQLASADGRPIGYAVEESLLRALVRKAFGKFDQRFEADMHIIIDGTRAGTIIRRPDRNDTFNVLEVIDARLDRRLALALAVLVLGSEP